VARDLLQALEASDVAKASEELRKRRCTAFTASSRPLNSEKGNPSDLLRTSSSPYL